MRCQMVTPGPRPLRFTPLPAFDDRGDARSVAIVGAGPGGLATAMLLAAAGLPVTVYESQPVVGGRTRRLQHGPYSFDCGPTFFMMPYVLEEIFAATGRKLCDYVQLERLDPMYRLIVGQPQGDAVVLDAIPDMARMQRQLRGINPADAEAFLRFMNHNRRKLERMRPLLQSPIRSVADLANLRSLRAGATLRPWRSLHDHLSHYFQNDAVRMAMCFQSKYLGMSPFECPELFSILPFIEYEYGVWHPRGGCNALVAAMAAACTEMGVDIRCSTPVERVLFQGKRATGVVAGGAEHSHRHVVINADAGWALRNLIPEEVRPPTLRDAALDRREYSCSTFMMYLGVEGAVDLPHHTIYTSRRYRENLSEISERGVLSEDPSIYVCNPSARDSTLAPAGHSSLYVLVPTPNNKPTTSHVDWMEARPILRERALTQLETVFGLRDIRRRIRSEHLVTAADWQGENIAHGATFSFAHTLGQMLHKRPHHRVQGLDATWLVGGGTHPGSGLPVIFLSSQITARLLCAEEGRAVPPAHSRLSSA
jgi:phytoene desaturase